MSGLRSIPYHVATTTYRFILKGAYAGVRTQPKVRNDSQTLLLIRTDEIGDFVLFTPMLKHLRAIYRDYKISLVVNEQFLNLAETCPYVDEVIPCKVKRYRWNFLYRLNFIRHLRARAFDAAIYPLYSREPLGDEILYCSGAAERIGFDGNFSSKARCSKTQNNRYYTRLIGSRHTMGTELERNQGFVEHLFGGKISESDFAPELWLTQEDRSFVSGLLEEAGLDSSRDLIVILFPGASWSGKIWPPNNYARLADQLVERYGARMVICGGPRDIPVTSAVAAQMKGDPTVLAGRTTLRQLAALLEVCALYVGNDTGPLHVAVTIGIPTLCIMGGGQFGRFYPYGDLDKHRMVFKEMPCYHCDWHCMYETTRCIQEISLDAVWHDARRLVEEIVLPSRDAFSAASQEQARPEQ